MKYICKYYSGGGEEYDGGIWEMIETPKSIIFTCIEKPFYDLACDEVLKCKKDNRCMHSLTTHKDGSFTIYPNRGGTPYYFEEIK